jgi:hypothetical protein
MEIVMVIVPWLNIIHEGINSGSTSDSGGRRFEVPRLAPMKKMIPVVD